MKRVFSLFRLVVFFLAASYATRVDAQNNYIKKYKPLVDSLSQVYKIPSSVIMAIAIVESSAGEGKNCKLLNNHFGIVGKNNLLQTKGIKTRYKQYDSPESSFVDFAQMISRRKYYVKLKGNKHASMWVDEISKHGYSEKPAEWRKRIKQTIKKNNL